MKKSLTALILAAAMVLGLMAGCTSAPPETTAAPLPDLETLYNQGMEVLAQMGDEAPILFPETNIDYINNFYPGIADIELKQFYAGVARKDYNDAVKDYNNKVIRFPGSIAASIFGFEKAEYFEADEESQTVPDVGAALGE